MPIKDTHRKERMRLPTSAPSGPETIHMLYCRKCGMFPVVVDEFQVDRQPVSVESACCYQTA